MLAETVEVSHDNNSLSNMPQPTKYDISQCYYNYETLNNHEFRATTNLDSSSVPYEYGHSPASPHTSSHSRSCSSVSKYDIFYSEYSKKPTEAREISNLDHSHGLSFGEGGTEASEVHSFSHPSERESVAYPMISSELSNSNIELPPEKFKLIKREPEDSLVGHVVDDISGITYNRESQNFTPDSIDDQYCYTTDLDTLHNFKRPNSSEEHCCGAGDTTVYGRCKVHQYVPVLGQADSSINNHEQKNSSSSSCTDQSDSHLYRKEFRTSIPSIPSESIVKSSSFGEHIITPPSPKLFIDDDLFIDNKERDLEEIKVNICELPEAKTGDLEHMSNLYPIDTFQVVGENHLLPGADHSENPQLYSDEAGYYHDEAPSQSGTSSMYKLEEPLKEPLLQPRISQIHHTSTCATDKYETDLTHSFTHGQCIPNSKAPNYTLNTNFLVNVKGTKNMDKASKVSPPDRKTKPHLLPPESDRYWTGPDENNNFLCLYKNCGKKFTRRYNIRTHIQTHLGDRPFMCKLCLKTFVRQHDLNRHTKLHAKSPKSKKGLENGSGAIYDTSNQWEKYEIVFNGWFSNRAITESHHPK